MSNSGATSGTDFKCDASLFLEGVNNANMAKSLVRNTISAASAMSDIEGMGEVIQCLNDCNVDLLVSKIDECKNSLLGVDTDFLANYFKLLNDKIEGFDQKSNDEEYLTQYSVYQKEYWNTVVNMLERNEDSLDDENKKNLEIARAYVGYYNVTDEMSANDVDSDKLINLFEKRKQYEIDLLKLQNLSDDDLSKALTELNNQYETTILSVKINATYEKISLLDINDDNYESNCIDLLKEEADYQKKLINLDSKLTDEEKESKIAAINATLGKNEIIVKQSVISNELYKLDINDEDYKTKCEDLLNKSRDYEIELCNLDDSLTKEERDEEIEQIKSKYEYTYFIYEGSKIENDIQNLDINASDYGDQYLSLLHQQRDWAEKMYRTNTDLTEEEIQAQLSSFDQEIENVEWNQMSGIEKSLQYAGTFGLSVLCGVIDVGENITDGLLMIWGKISDNEEEMAELVKADFSENVYATWASGLNNNAAYSDFHTIGTMVGGMLGYGGISVLSGGILGVGSLGAVTLSTVIGGAGAAGSASERALNNGATYDEALTVGATAFVLAAGASILSNYTLVSKMKSSLSLIGGPLSLNNTLKSTIASIGEYAIKGGLIGTIEPVLNPIIEYNVYAKDLEDKDGNLMYDNLIEYYTETGALTNVVMGFGSGAFGAVSDYLNVRADYVGQSVRRNKKNNKNANTDADGSGNKSLLNDDSKASIEKAPEVETDVESIGNNNTDKTTSSTRELRKAEYEAIKDTSWDSGKIGTNVHNQDGLDTSTGKFPEIGTEVTNYGGQDGYTAIAKGGSYAKLDEICKKYGMTRDDFLALTRTRQHNIPTIEQKKAVFNIRRELSADVTDAAGAIKPGTSISKSIPVKDFNDYYCDGNEATLRGCVALSRDVDALGGNAEEIINGTGLKYDGSKFINENGEPNDFYIVEAKLQQDQPAVGVRISATTDATEISPSVASEFKNKHPNYKYNGYDIDDISKNDTYLNEIWTRKGEAQRTELSELSGVPKDRIVVEEAKFYNKPTNPDVGNGFTLNQGNSKAFGLPEFYVYDGNAVKVYDGAIYKISGGKKIKVAIIDITGRVKILK